jgi:uncharacterized repeat protein (TIGR01451 family)
MKLWDKQAGTMRASHFYNSLAALLLAGFAVAANADSAASALAIRAIAEVEINGKLQPADRVVSGDQIYYSLEVRNTGAVSLAPPTVTYPIPAHVRYLADSAVGPGSQVSYSVDGVRFDTPENLTVLGPDGRPRTAAAADYTQIRWQLKRRLKGNSVAFVRFRAVVK